MSKRAGLAIAVIALIAGAAFGTITSRGGGVVTAQSPVCGTQADSCWVKVGEVFGSICTEQDGVFYGTGNSAVGDAAFGGCVTTIHLPPAGVTRAELDSVVASEVQSAITDVAARKAAAKKCAAEVAARRKAERQHDRDVARGLTPVPLPPNIGGPC